MEILSSIYFVLCYPLSVYGVKKKQTKTYIGPYIFKPFFFLIVGHNKGANWRQGIFKDSQFQVNIKVYKCGVTDCISVISFTLLVILKTKIMPCLCLFNDGRNIRIYPLQPQTYYISYYIRYLNTYLSLPVGVFFLFHFCILYKVCPLVKRFDNEIVSSLLRLPMSNT